MQLFIVSKDPEVCARYLDDRRVRKILIESAQMLAACTQERERSQLARRLGSRLTVVKRMAVATDKGLRFCYGDVREAAPSTDNAHLADTAARALQTLSQLLR